ncbi:DUF4367 domain-containing protein [Desulfotomaculum copahuensis]|uniref:DUF4367 domain-containing protein n=1 Tax=Desulfotomaculum copahuensis TaxID=1838280 RepID=A0A1B7LB82_9FIRM|nr:DUF4367 domain-containing protein [Desulfotomaculum copahuensis]OAT79501.1 hypothetical protein A6M21_15470 [Desulfotomaculum copahuensis]
MKQYTDEELDLIIRAVMRARVEDGNPPPVEATWTRLKDKVSHRPGIKRPINFNARHSPGVAVAAILVLLAAIVISLSVPGKVGALGYKVMDGITELLYGSQMNLRGGVTSEDATKPPPPPGEIKEIKMEPPSVVTLKQAREQSPFPLKVPGYLPPGYRLEKVTYQKQSPYTAQIFMEYNGPGNKYFNITQFNFNGELGTGFGYDKEDTTIKNVTIGPCQAKLALHKNELIHLMWIDGYISLDLDGRLSARDAEQIADSMYVHRDQK